MDNKKFSNENIRIRKVLQDVIYYTYHKKVSAETLKKYNKFYIYLSDKNTKSRAGQYNIKTHTIQITGMDRDSKHILVTCIHELTHHIDYCNRGITDHTNLFYQIFKELLITSLNMKIFNIKDLNYITDTYDGNKIKKMISNYKPRYIPYKNDLVIIRVYNAFPFKEHLKINEYNYCSTDTTWYREINKDEQESEIEWLKELGINEKDIKVEDGNDISIKVKGKIVIDKGSYEYKEQLKELGFIYKNKRWIKYVEDNNLKEAIKEYKEKIPQLNFKYEI